MWWKAAILRPQVVYFVSEQAAKAAQIRLLRCTLMDPGFLEVQSVLWIIWMFYGTLGLENWLMSVLAEVALG